MANSSIRDFYKNRSIFVTGATGFMGKVLVAKLLISCPQIKNIYLLIRPKSGKSEKTRMEQLLNAKIFDVVKSEVPDALEKLVIVSGNIELPNLGLSSNDEKRLVDNVSVVFHSAATVKFDEELRKSVEINAGGTRRILNLCRKMPLLKAVVHVSTAYCNCEENRIDERIYLLKTTPDQVFGALEWMNQKTIDTIGPQLLEGRPNNYAYTKALSENVILEEHGVLPVAIIRPSTVGPTWKDPMPGWIDCINAISGLLIACGKGVVRTIHCKSNKVVDVVPVDVCTNMMIAIAWHMAVYKPSDVLVYNCTSGSINRITFQEACDYYMEHILKNPFKNMLWYPATSLKTNKLCNDICGFFYHSVPAYGVDALAYITGNKPFMVNIQHRIGKGLKMLDYFCNREWQFSDNNYWRLWEDMTEEDKCEFNFDLRQLNWSSYFENCVFWGNIYLLKGDSSDLPMARRELRRLYFVRKATHAVGMMIFLYLLFMTYQFFFQD